MNSEMKKYWESVGKSACPDDIARDLSITAISKHLPDGAKVLDLGCGNGYCTYHFANSGIASIDGLDFSASSIDSALDSKRLAPEDLSQKINFRQGDALNLHHEVETYDVVITVRCLINLSGINDQLKALYGIHNLLNPGGTYLMCENVQSGLDFLNDYRKSVGLDEIKTRWHNSYLDNSFFPELEKLFHVEQVDHFASTYYFVSRVINAWLSKQSGVEPSYEDPLNYMASKLPVFGEFSPMRLYVLKKI